jgi:hypothetical protein
MATMKKASAKKPAKAGAASGKKMPPWMQKATPKKKMGGSMKKGSC